MSRVIPHSMHSANNKELSPEERQTLASIIHMTKMLKIERRLGEYRPPQRLTLSNYALSVITPSAATDFLDFTINVPIKFVQLLDPKNTHIQVEQASLYMTQTRNPISVFAYNVSLPGVPSNLNWNTTFDGSFPATATDAGDLYTSSIVSATNGDIVFTGGLTYNGNINGQAFQPYNHKVNSNEVGFPLTDLQFLNNSVVNIRVRSTTQVLIPGVEYEFLFNLGMVFYTYTGGE